MARTKGVWRTVGWLIGGAALLGWSGAAPADGEGVQEVTVLNFPDLQRVDGAVAVKAPVQLDSQFVQRKLTVVPAGPTKAREVTDGGVLELGPFARVVVSLAGETTSRIVAPGAVGALLVPDDPDILSIWQETGRAQLAIRVEAQVAPTDRGLFESPSVELRPAFPRYRVYFYDTLSSSVELRFYALSTSS